MNRECRISLPKIAAESQIYPQILINTVSNHCFSALCPDTVQTQMLALFLTADSGDILVKHARET